MNRPPWFLSAGWIVCLFGAALFGIRGELGPALVALVGFVGWFVAGMYREDILDLRHRSRR